MKDLSSLRAQLKEIAETAPAARAIDRRVRRRVRVRRSIPVAMTALSLVAVATTGFAISGRREATTSADQGRGSAAASKSCVWRVATLGALSGDFASVSGPITEAIEFAVAEGNERGDLPCRIEVRAADTQGDFDVAPRLAQGIAEDDSVIACICPYSSSETLAAGSVFGSSGLLMAGVGTNETLDEEGFDTWFGAAVPDDVQGEAAGEYIAGTGADNVALIHDGQEYSKTFAAAVQRSLGDRVTGSFRIDPAHDDYSQVVEEVAAMNADFVFFGGYTPEAGPLVRALRAAGVQAPFMSDAGTHHPEFGRLARRAAAGALVVSPAADARLIDAAAPFVAGMQAKYGEDSPGLLGVEAYDVTELALESLRTYEGDVTDTKAVRAHVVASFDEAQGYDGLAKTYSWNGDGAPENGAEAVWIYEWDASRGGFVGRGPVAAFLD